MYTVIPPCSKAQTGIITVLYCTPKYTRAQLVPSKHSRAQLLSVY